MKSLIGIMLILVLAEGGAYAATSISQQAQLTVASVLSIEFWSSEPSNEESTSFGSSAIKWTDVDPSAGNRIRPTDSSLTRPDTAVICRHNGPAGNWYLKMNIEGDLADKMKFYMPQPINWNTKVLTNGALTFQSPDVEEDWPLIPKAPTVIYASGTNDRINTPFGTYIAVSYAVNPIELQAGTSYSSTIIYSITTSP